MATDATSVSLPVAGRSRQETRPNLLGATRGQLEALFSQMGEKRFRAAQISKWIHRHRVADFDAMTDLGKALRARLKDVADIRAPAVEEERISRDGTRKWLLRVDSGNCVEMVFIPEEPRGTLCISSQVGCALNCTFCHTARQGFNRNLSAAEIVAQLWMARQLLEPSDEPGSRITNVVLMGMGEPLLNFENVASALQIMLDDNAYGLARRRVTLSTAGVVPKIDALKDRCPVSLAVSLHAPNDALRDRLVPINRHYPIDDLLAACRRYLEGESRQKITFEYVMLEEVNDRPAHAQELARLLGDLPAKVNLIPFNPFPGSDYRRSAPAVVDAFRDILLAAGVMTITRKTRGEDIDAACGQLAGEVRARGRRPGGERTARHAASAP